MERDREREMATPFSHYSVEVKPFVLVLYTSENTKHNQHTPSTILLKVNDS